MSHIIKNINIKNLLHNRLCKTMSEEGMKIQYFILKRKNINIQKNINKNNDFKSVYICRLLRWLSGRAFTSRAGYRGSILGRDRPRSLKQVVTSLLSSAR